MLIGHESIGSNGELTCASSKGALGARHMYMHIHLRFLSEGCNIYTRTDVQNRL
jgi:hypothetical protein